MTGMGMQRLQQKGPRLRLGDVVRILDKGQEGVIAICVEDDGHAEYPWCCMPVVVTSATEQREEIWPVRYERIGNVVELVALKEEAAQLVKYLRKLVRSSHDGHLTMHCRKPLNARPDGNAGSGAVVLITL